MTAIAGLAVTAMLAAVPAPAHATVSTAAAGDPALTLEALGLTVVENDGYIAASGPAGAVQLAASLFSVTGDVALYTGNGGTGTGYIVLSGDPATIEVEMLIPPGVVIDSAANDTTDQAWIFSDTGTPVVDETPGTASDIPPTDANVVVTNDIQAPVESSGSSDMCGGENLHVYAVAGSPVFC